VLFYIVTFFINSSHWRINLGIKILLFTAIISIVNVNWGLLRERLEKEDINETARTTD